jgi:hypothetical protein
MYLPIKGRKPRGTPMRSRSYIRRQDKPRRKLCSMKKQSREGETSSPMARSVNRRRPWRRIVCRQHHTYSLPLGIPPMPSHTCLISSYTTVLLPSAMSDPHPTAAATRRATVRPCGKDSRDTLSPLSSSGRNWGRDLPMPPTTKEASPIHPPRSDRRVSSRAGAGRARHPTRPGRTDGCGAGPAGLPSDHPH